MDEGALTKIAFELGEGTEQGAAQLRSVLDEEPWLIVSEDTEDNARTPMGSVVLAVPLNSAFLAASQQFVKSTNNVVAILDPEAQRILASSSSDAVPAGLECAPSKIFPMHGTARPDKISSGKHRFHCLNFFCCFC